MSTTVYICGDQPQITHGVSDAVVIDGLCKNPSEMGESAADTERVVLILHEESYDVPAVQKALRGIDVDPLGAQIVDVGSETSELLMPVIVGGLKARATEFVGSTPEHIKPVLPGPVTRRGFLRPPTPVCVSAPRIDHSVCASGDGCRICVDVCPQDAYIWQAGRIIYDKGACLPCGGCVTACPTGAIENPAYSTAMIVAQQRSIIADSDDPIGIRFVCSGGTAEPPKGWFDIAVPCTSMVPGTWLIASLLLGAGAATALPCTESECQLGLDAGAIAANDFAHALLTEFCLDSSAVTGNAILDPIDGDLIEGSFEYDSATDVVLALSSVLGSEINMVHPASNIGVVEIDAESCTLCGLCAKSCPTNALIEVYEEERVSISFEARSCVNCRQCISACPEIESGAISVSGRIDVALLKEERRDLNKGGVSTCGACGAAIAPSPLMGRISELLGDEFTETVDMLSSRCIDCRGRR